MFSLTKLGITPHLPIQETENKLVKVKLAVPKGSLEQATFDFLENAGYQISAQQRTYRPTIDDPKIELKVLRPQEIPIFVAEGLHDMGITGVDWVTETNADVETLLDLEYGHVKLVLAVPRNWSDINNLTELLEKFWTEGKNIRISTEYLNATSRYVRSNPLYRKNCGEEEPQVITPWWRKGENSRVSVFLSFGATEAKPHEDADAIVDIIQTGTTLEQNNLKPIETLMESSAVLIANKRAIVDPLKREKIYDILTLMKGVVDGRKKLHIFLNVNKDNLPKLIEKLPALKGPTVSPLSTEGWYAVNTVIDRSQFLELLPTLRKLAQGLVVHEPRQILPLEEIMEVEEGASSSYDQG